MSPESQRRGNRASEAWLTPTRQIDYDRLTIEEETHARDVSPLTPFPRLATPSTSTTASTSSSQRHADSLASEVLRLQQMGQLVLQAFLYISAFCILASSTLFDENITGQ